MKTTLDNTDRVLQAISIRGASEHNLKEIDLELPIGKLVAITGVSGSGKSSLLFDTIFVEGHRRFLETAAFSGRGSIAIPAPPAVRSIVNLPPVIALSQQRGRFSTRNTLAMLADLAAPLRLLFAKLGTAHCPECSREVSRQTVEQIVARILRLEERRKVMILAPVVRGKKGAHKQLLEQLANRGFVRVRIDDELCELDPLPQLKAGRAHSIDVVIDRIIVKPGIQDRLTESVELALREGNETCLIAEQLEGGWNDRLYSSRYACPDCDLSFAPLESRSFNPNSPYGACLECEGSGWSQEIEQPILCHDCEGSGLCPFSHRVTFAEQPFPHIMSRSVAEAREFFESLEIREEDPIRRKVLELLLPEIRQSLHTLDRVGLGYLQLNRTVPSLSAGEFQRARLSAILTGGFSGTAYLLDEPTAGLHSSDSERLIAILKELCDKGNSVIVVEHDMAVIQLADHVIELGPGAGVEGGSLLFSGPPEELQDLPASPTAQALAGEAIPTNNTRRIPRTFLRIEGAACHNLNNLDVEIPLGVLACVSGVSGSGKSTLVHDVLHPTLRNTIDRTERPTVGCRGLSGTEALFAVRFVDQSPLGRNGRSNPATATGIWNEVRRILAGTREAKLRGFPASRFSFQSSVGRCEVCKGRGERVFRMPFLPEVRTICPQCRGTRFNSQTLSISYKGMNAADILDLSLTSACEFFASFPLLSNRLNVLCELGLGYLKLGQPAPTLSGGEAQRIKLAAELGKTNAGPTLFLLDEPTSGLHMCDIALLLKVLHQLIEAGHSILAIEHHPHVLAAADWIIDLGPGAGPEGGHLVASGSPEIIAESPISKTGQVLAEILKM
ncbi:MAG TPA: excinuclease ABC subunit UvrA [Planctomycetaceae bacterium]|nr:excinuclease ABC subunit UvrA [Planctomycetaceae bacterium]